MSIKRRQKRAIESHGAVLADMLGRFYEFLAKRPQPSDQEVRAEFIQRDHSWRSYCAKKQMNKSANSLFTEQVAQLWKRKMQKNEATEN